ncbi:hypothetical protein QEZ54_14540 [Catellatospora sp. KI3]|uniref:hypothetical protein n=1 Tax=Catellatospora sp. KI3 TaxID=3041620 RepID=UPI0024828CB9|nr:hypothetical protein [Catellatospora sp. KI3]MDI1462184.1 hypothetical protein [Catellatospora sp. KI3]
MSGRYGELDFGLTDLLKAFHQDWRHGGTDVEVLSAYAAKNPPYLLESVLIDALRLDESAVPTWAIEALWSAATDRCHDLRRAGWDGREWLRRIVQLSQERLLQEREGFQARVPSGAYGHLTGAVLDEIALVAVGLLESSLRAGPRYVPGVVPALSLVATHACPDLAFRLLLRELTAYGHEVTRSQYDRYVALGASFDYGQFLVGCYDHLVAPD